MNLRQCHSLVSQPLLKIQGANLKLKNPRFIANISFGIFRTVKVHFRCGRQFFAIGN